jgi:Flp pilus assembly pilin Flp
MPKGGEPMLKLGAFRPAFAGSRVDALRRREEGQTMAEYGVVLAVITPAMIGAITLLSSSVRNTLLKVVGLLPG